MVMVVPCVTAKEVAIPWNVPFYSKVGGVYHVEFGDEIIFRPCRENKTALWYTESRDVYERCTSGRKDSMKYIYLGDACDNRLYVRKAVEHGPITSQPEVDLFFLTNDPFDCKDALRVTVKVTTKPTITASAHLTEIEVFLSFILGLNMMCWIYYIWRKLRSTKSVTLRKRTTVGIVKAIKSKKKVTWSDDNEYFYYRKTITAVHDNSDRDIFPDAAIKDQILGSGSE